MEKKKPLTLIEVTLSLGLSAIILSFLFSSLLQTIRTSRAIAKFKKQTFENAFCYARLLPIFAHSDPSTFNLEEGKLSLSFENGLDPHLIFSGKTEASLSLQDHTLFLNISSRDGSQTRKEALFTHIESFTWEPKLPFFVTLHLKQTDREEKEFVFFFPDHTEGFPLT